MNTLGIAAIGIAVLIALAFCIQFLTRRSVNVETLTTHRASSQAVLGVVGTLFSVLIGFMVASSLDAYREAKHHIEAEGNALGTIFRLARGLPEVDRMRIRSLCREYCTNVIDDEWKAMENKQSSQLAWHSYEQIWGACISISPKDLRESNLQQAILAAAYNFAEHRRARIVDSQAELPSALWLVISIGSIIITIVIACVFATEAQGFQRWLLSFVAVSLGLNIWLLSVFSAPFSGALRLQPTTFILDRDVIFRGPDTPAEYLPKNF